MRSLFRFDNNSFFEIIAFQEQSGPFGDDKRTTELSNMRTKKIQYAIYIYLWLCVCVWRTRMYACVYVYYLASSNTCRGSCVLFHVNTLSLVSVSLVVNPSRRPTMKSKPVGHVTINTSPSKNDLLWKQMAWRNCRSILTKEFTWLIYTLVDVLVYVG